MNLNKLFNIQAKLDERIVQEHNLQGQDLLDEKILALQVELGELANELPEVFKFWSNKKNDYDKALVEYCDCLHFILSIGLDIDLNFDKHKNFISPKKMPNILDQFMWTNYKVNNLYKAYRDEGKNYMAYDYVHAFNAVIGLGEMIGFTTEQIFNAYLDKNKINHERQLNGY